ncbi:uncharacterized protein LOC113355338 [Papaver somniferum]|uniref:uncharacterized protein LOC113355338 n=1 Tax=Papaver somniferum TaxID=3469 RepID=UPI000E6F9CE8|nr:uncharacterized protein LOC113355338 [Papaver somniferum]
MIDCKPCDTPVIKGARVYIHDGTKLGNASDYRTIVGSLQYLTITIPNICFGVNYVFQFMHSPTNVHLQLVKSILRYLKGTIGLGVTLRKDSLNQLKQPTISKSSTEAEYKCLSVASA